MANTDKNIHIPETELVTVGTRTWMHMVDTSTLTFSISCISYHQSTIQHLARTGTYSVPAPSVCHSVPVHLI